MVDLSNWDFAEQFTCKEAAALIAGIDPREAVGGSPIATRINEATVKAFIAVARGTPPPPDGLLTRELAITMHPDFVPSIFLDATGSSLHGIETLDRAEIVRWLSAIGAISVYQFDFGSRLPIDTTSPATPAPVDAVGASNCEPPTNWRHLIQAEAYEHWLRLRASGCNPSVFSICPDMARWCIEKNVKGDKGQNPTAGTIRNTVLGGGNWTPPFHSVAEAKRHIAQIAQTAQKEVAHVAR